MSEERRRRHRGRSLKEAAAVLAALVSASALVGAQPAPPAGANVLRLEAAPTASLQIQLPAADLHVVADDTREVTVSVERPAGLRATEVVSLERGGDDRVRLTSASQAAARSADLSVRVRVPRAMALDDVRVDSGAVSLEGLHGRVVAVVVRGAIEARDLRGRARLEIETGDITARGVILDDGASLKCRTFNGHVRIELDRAPVNARILALTLNGTVRSPLPLETRAAFGPRFAQGTFGAAEHVLSIDVVRGDIDIDVRRR